MSLTVLCKASVWSLKVCCPKVELDRVYLVCLYKYTRIIDEVFDSTMYYLVIRLGDS